MGESTSFVLVTGLSQEQLLERLGMRLGEVIEEPDSSRHGVAALGPTLQGWTLLVDPPRVLSGDEAGLARLSRGAWVLVLELEEHVMHSQAEVFYCGQRLWRVSSTGEHGVTGRSRITSDGDPPPELGELLEAALRQERERERGDVRVDYQFDVPIDLAAMATGGAFHYPRTWDDDWLFRALEPVTVDRRLSGREMLKAWRSAEREALARLGFAAVGTDEYEWGFDGGWVGGVSLRKRAGGPVGRGGVVSLDLFGFSLGHLPTERLVGQLKGQDPDATGTVTLPGWPKKDLPSEVVGRLDRLRIEEPSMAADAAALVARMVEGWVVPWLRAGADLRRLPGRLDSRNLGGQGRTLERVAVIAYQLGDRDAALAALREYRAKCCATGIPAIDEPSNRFAEGLQRLVGGSVGADGA
jgi:hypothetical protein